MTAIWTLPMTAGHAIGRACASRSADHIPLWEPQYSNTYELMPPNHAPSTPNAAVDFATADTLLMQAFNAGHGTSNTASPIKPVGRQN